MELFSCSYSLCCQLLSMEVDLLCCEVVWQPVVDNRPMISTQGLGIWVPPLLCVFWSPWLDILILFDESLGQNGRGFCFTSLTIHGLHCVILPHQTFFFFFLLSNSDNQLRVVCCLANSLCLWSEGQHSSYCCYFYHLSWWNNCSIQHLVCSVSVTCALPKDFANLCTLLLNRKKRFQLLWWHDTMKK